MSGACLACRCCADVRMLQQCMWEMQSAQASALRSVLCRVRMAVRLGARWDAGSISAKGFE